MWITASDIYCILYVRALHLQVLTRGVSSVCSCTTISANERDNGSVCVHWWHCLLLYSAWQMVCASTVTSPPCLLSSRITSIAPLFFTAAIIVGTTNSSACIRSWKEFVATKPLISPCKSMRGRNKARQQENDHCGFFSHSFRLWHKFKTYWTERKQKIDFWNTRQQTGSC